MQNALDTLVRPITVADLVIDALVQSEWELSARVAALTLENEQLVTLVADLAMERTCGDIVLRGWLAKARADGAASEQQAERLREELRRFVSARCA